MSKPLTIRIFSLLYMNILYMNISLCESCIDKNEKCIKLGIDM